MKTDQSLVSIYDILLCKYGQQRWWPCKIKDEIITGAVLTQNTNWQNVEKSLDNLRKQNLDSLERIVEADPGLISELIKPSGYYNVKTKRLLNLVNFILEHKNNLELLTPADLRCRLLSINGVGPETADTILLYYFELPFFVIDKYTIRIFSRIGFFSENVNYHEAQFFFASNLRKDVKLYNEFHALIVKFAKILCKSKPKCDECFLKNLCDFFKRQSS